MSGLSKKKGALVLSYSIADDFFLIWYFWLFFKERCIKTLAIIFLCVVILKIVICICGNFLTFISSLYLKIFTCFSISSMGWGSWCCFCSRCKHCSRIKSWRMLVRLEGVTSLKLGGGLEQYNGGLLWPIGSKKKTCSLVPHSALRRRKNSNIQWHA